MEEDEVDKGEDTALLGLGTGAVDIPVSIGMSSKLAVHTGPVNINVCQKKQILH